MVFLKINIQKIIILIKYPYFIYYLIQEREMTKDKILRSKDEKIS